MARMIPPEIPESAPPSEKIIFENLMRAPQNWVVFHSEYVDNPNNPARAREIDFLIFTDTCSIICLEVKGGSYIIDSNQWYRLPSRELVNPSPTQQSRSAMFAFQNEFSSSYFGSNSLLSVGCAVALTDSEFPSTARQPREALVIERTDARDPYKLSRALSDYADALPTNRVKRLLVENREKCIEALTARDDLLFELEQTMIVDPPERITRQDLDTLRPQLLRLTNDQINSLKRTDLNDRCVIDGAAGTGKTVLALELARRRCEAGETVALLCSNPNLSRRFEGWAKTLPDNTDNGTRDDTRWNRIEKWVKRIPGNIGGRIVAGTPATLPLGAFIADRTRLKRHRQRLEQARQSGPEGSSILEESLKFGYPDSKWRQFIKETVADLGQKPIFDYLIVDEAQNLCDEMFFKLMGVLLKGGLANGRWAMFGDFTNQDIVSPNRVSRGMEVLKHFGYNWANDRLETNCRNTQEIAETFTALVDIESPPRSGVHGPLVQIEYFGSMEERDQLLDKLVHDLKDRYFLSRQIILLTSGRGDRFDAAREYGGWKLLNIRESEEVDEVLKDREYVPTISGDPSSETLRWSDVYDFQGLESDLAILVLPVTEEQIAVAGDITLPREKHLRRVLYTGMSRAKTMLVIVAHRSYERTIKLRMLL